MAGANKLAQVLHELSGGADFDSTGQFTLDIAKAVKKVEVSAQQDPTRWLLYGVQAAVAFRATRVDLSFSHTACSLSFDLNENWRDLERQSDLLEAPAGAEAGALSRLRNAVLWSRALQPARMELLFASPNRGFLLTLSDQGTARTAQASQSQPRLCLLVDFQLKSKERIAQLGRVAAACLSFCPVPVWQEGLLLNSGLFSHCRGPHGLAARWILDSNLQSARLAGIHPARTPALFYHAAGQNFVRGRKPPATVLQRVEVGGDLGADATMQLFASEQPDQLMLATWQNGVEANSFLMLRCQRPQVPEGWSNRLLTCRAYFFRERKVQSRLFVVDDGLTLQPIALENCPEGWSVAVAATSLKTDLSGLKLLEDENLKALCRWVVGQILALHHRAAEQTAV